LQSLIDSNTTQVTQPCGRDSARVAVGPCDKTPEVLLEMLTSAAEISHEKQQLSDA
jgi:hypothetical protein